MVMHNSSSRHKFRTDDIRTRRRGLRAALTGLEILETRFLLSNAAVAGCGCAACQAAAMAMNNGGQNPNAVQPIIRKLAVGTSPTAGTASKPLARTVAAGSNTSGIWQPLVNTFQPPGQNVQSYIHPAAFTPFGIDARQLKATLANAPMEFTAAGRSTPVILSIPNPNGTLSRFKVVESPVMAPELAAKFPDIKTYSGQGIDNPAETARFDYTLQGFHAQVISPQGAWYIDPYFHLDQSTYISYFKRDLAATTVGSFKCLTQADALDDDVTALAGGPDATSGSTLRTYRTAVSATTEYTAFQGGTVPLGLSAVTTAVNRISGVYETDFAVRLQLIANENLLIYTGADPFGSPGNAGTSNNNNQTSLDTTILNANYDIGHVFHRGTDNGLAGAIGNACVTGQKAKGYSSHSNPVNDPFSIDYVAHEMGHQFGGRHSFNNCSGSGGDSYNVLPEVGSGSTIMSYAGICSNNLQAHSDAYFYSINHNQIVAYTTTGAGNAVANQVPTGNNIPTVDAGLDFTIPRSTPFILTAVGSDLDADTLTYAWEERDVGTGPVSPGVDNGIAPIMRGWNPTTDNTRTLPRLSNLLSNTNAFGEILPTTGRTLNFTVQVRDNRAGGGASTTDAMIITVVNTGAGFAVTSPNTTGIVYNGGTTQNVDWNVAGTTGSGINTANVNIKLSTDGGLTYPITLAAATANDGSEPIQIPFNLGTTQARIKVEAVGNIFFDISNQNFQIINVPDVPVPAQPTLAPSSDTGASNSDRITRLNNSSAGSVLEFSVGGTTAGYTVKLYADGVFIGGALAAGATTTVTTNGTTTIPDGVRAITARQQLGANPESIDSTAISVTIDTIAPTLSAPVNFVYATQPHKLVYSFSENVGGSLDNGDVAVTLLPSTPVAKTLSYNGSFDQGTFDFGGVLADGDYTAALTGSGVFDVAGNPMVNNSFPFFFMMADFNHDRQVNTNDFTVLAANFNQTGKNFTQGDATYDSIVNTNDFTVLAARFNTALAAGSPAGSAVGNSGRPAPTTLRAGPPPVGSSIFGDVTIGNDATPAELRDLLDDLVGGVVMV